MDRILLDVEELVRRSAVLAEKLRAAAEERRRARDAGQWPTPMPPDAHEGAQWRIHSLTHRNKPVEQCRACRGWYLYPHLCRDHALCGACHPAVTP
jgi:hypothetical protein